MLEQAERFWQPPPLEALKSAHLPVARWLEALGWLEWRTLELPDSREAARRLDYWCGSWPTWDELSGQRPPRILVKGRPESLLDGPAAGARAALEHWASRLPLVRVPSWILDIAIATVLHYEFRQEWRWICRLGRQFQCVGPIVGWSRAETKEQFIRRARREFEQQLRDYIRRFECAHGLGLRRNTTREYTAIRDAEWTARYLAGTPAYRMSEDFDEDAVLKAIHRFCDRIGLDLATVRRPPEPFGRAQGRAQNAVLRQRLRSLCADAGSQSNLS